MKVTPTWIWRAAAVALAALALVPLVGRPAAGQENPPPAAGLPPLPPPVLPSVTTQDLLDGLKNPARWLTYSGDYTGRRHSPLKQITVDNVHRLAAQWTFQAEGMVIGRGFESTPLVMDGVLYITGNNNIAWAVDARTGRQIWRYRRALPPGLTYGAGNPSNRGFAALGDRLFMSTLDGHLLAFDRNTGRVVWDTLVDDYKAGHALIAAPLIVKDKVVIGNSGGDLPTRGFVDAYDPRTGARLWRFYTIPGPGEPGSESWSDADVLPRGGGAAWVTGSYDPELNLIYWGTGNPNPDYYGGDRKGSNLFTASLVALDADTGRLKWHYQFTPHDLHDWDSNHVPVLADITVRGQARKVVMVANRNGFFYTLDRTTGELLVAKPFITTKWAREVGPDGADRLERRRHSARRLGSHDPVRARFPRRHRLQPAVVRPGAAALLRHGARDLRLLHAAEVGGVPGPRLHERRDAQAARPRLQRAARHRPQDRRHPLGAQVPHLVARRCHVHGVGRRVRGRQRRLLQRLRGQDRQAPLVVSHRLADLGRGGQHLHAGRAAARR